MPPRRRRGAPKASRSRGVEPELAQDLRRVLAVTRNVTDARPLPADEEGVADRGNRPDGRVDLRDEAVVRELRVVHHLGDVVDVAARYARRAEPLEPLGSGSLRELCLEDRLELVAMSDAA